MARIIPLLVRGVRNNLDVFFEALARGGPPTFLALLVIVAWGIPALTAWDIDGLIQEGVIIGKAIPMPADCLVIVSLATLFLVVRTILILRSMRKDARASGFFRER